MGKITSLTSLFETWPLDWLETGVLNSHEYVEARDRFGGMPNDENFWMWREFLRIRTGEYKIIPGFVWDTGHTGLTHPETRFHFQHVCNAHPGLLCYTQDESKGRRDIQTPIKMGRYTTKYLSGYDARDLACKFEAFFNPPELKFARTREEICRVYDEGPHSCMKNKRVRAYDQYGEYEDICPTEVYAGPDTAVAYLGDYTVDEGVYARCVVNEVRKEYIRAYGYTDLIECALEKAGYTQGDLDDCRVLYFRRHDEPVMPYLDSEANTCEVSSDDYVRIGYDLEYIADQTHGGVMTNTSRCTCDECGDRCDEEDMTYVDDADMTVCQHCLQRNFTMAYTGRHQEYVRDADYSFYEHNGDVYTEDGLAYHDLVILADDSVADRDDVEEDLITNEFIKRDDAVRVLDPDGNESWTLPTNVTVQNFPDMYFDVDENTVYMDLDYEQALELELVSLDDFLTEFPTATHPWDFSELRAGSLLWADWDFRKAVLTALNSEITRLNRNHATLTHNYLMVINGAPTTTTNLWSHYA